MRRLLLIGLLMVASIAAAKSKPKTGKPATHQATTGKPAPAPQLGAHVDAYLQPYIALDLFQGAVLIAHGDKVLLEKGYGDANVELHVRNTPANVFRIASLTKPFTEVLLGRLVEQEKLALDAPLSRYLPDFPQGDSITIDMLRLHSAGIPSMNSIPYDEEASAPNTLDSLVRRIARTPLDFPPGSRRRYSEATLHRIPFLRAGGETGDRIVGEVEHARERIARRAEIRDDVNVIRDPHRGVLLLARVALWRALARDLAVLHAAVVVKDMLVGLAFGRAVRPDEADRLAANATANALPCVVHGHPRRRWMSAD